MPEPKAVESVDFVTPIKRLDLTGVEADEMTTVRFGYKVKPDGSGCLHIPVEELPDAFRDWLLEQAKAQEEANHAAQ